MLADKKLIKIKKMVRKLQFLNTWTIPEFKADKKVKKIEVVQNQTTGKCFFLYGLDRGACSSKVAKGELTNPVISEVCNKETAEIFLLLHSKGENNIVQLAVL